MNPCLRFAVTFGQTAERPLPARPADAKGHARGQQPQAEAATPLRTGRGGMLSAYGVVL